MNTRRAILHITTAHLKDLLQLPAEAEIDGIELDFCQPDLVLVRINGAGWPTAPGQTIVNTTGVCFGGGISWNLPQGITGGE